METNSERPLQTLEEILDMKQWDKSSAEDRPHIWMSDCQRLVSHVENPKDEKLENTRLSIDVAGLKQLSWTRAD